MHKRTPSNCGLLMALTSLAALAACAGTSGNGTGTTPAPAPAQPVTEQEASTAANEIVGLFADDGASKAKFIAESKTMEEMGGEADCAPQVAPKPGEKPPPPNKCEKESFDSEQVAKDIKEWFSDHLFNAKLKDNKLSTDKMVVYCLAAEDICDHGDDISSPPEPGLPGDGGGSDGSDGKSDDPGGDDACIKGLKDVPVCVAVIKHGDKDLSGKVIVGYDPQVIPITFTMKPDKLTLDADVAKLLEAAKMVAKATGEELPEEFPQVALGAVGAQLLRGADKTITGTLSIKQMVHLGAFDKTHKKFYDVKVAPATTALKVVLGQADHTVLVAGGLETIDIGLAADMLFGKSNSVCVSGGGSTGKPTPPPGDGEDEKDPPPPGDGDKEDPPGGGCGDPEPATPKEGAFFASIGGASFEVNLTVDADKEMDTISVTGLGLGSKTTTVKYDDGKASHDLAAFDLNKDATPPRKLDLKVTYDGDQVKLLVVPQLDAILAHTLAAVAKMFDDDMPKFLHKGTSQVIFDGAGTPTLEFKPPKGKTGQTTEPMPVPDPGKGGDDKGGDGGDDKGGKEPPGDDGDMDEGGFPHIKVLAGLLTLKAWGMDGIADVNVSVKAGSCLVENEGKGEGKGGESKEKESHFFGQFASGACQTPTP